MGGRGSTVTVRGEQDRMSAGLFDYRHASPVEYPKRASLAAANNALNVHLSENDYRALVGAPADTTFRVSFVEGSSVGLEFWSDAVVASRVIERQPNGKLTLTNENIIVTDTGRGLGTRIFAKSVETAAKLGVDKIETYAVRSTSDNGYYTWPRLGYKMSVAQGEHFDNTDLLRAAGFGGVENSHDLFSRPGGAEWWKANGSGNDAVFDLRRGSTSRKILSAYLKKKGIRV
jgi:hypothetical protein